MTLLVPKPSSLFFIFHRTILAFERFFNGVLIPHMLFKSVYPCKLGATFNAFMFLDTEVMFAFYVVEQVTLFAEA